jgi:hypothetical protein
MELTFKATGSGAIREERLRRSRRPPTRAFSLVLGLIAAALVLGRAGTTSSPEPGRVHWDQESITFDSQRVGVRASRTLTGTNVGGTEILVGSLRLEGSEAGDFSVVKDGCSGRRLAPNKTCRALLLWQPTTPGRRTAQVLLDGEALAEPARLQVEGEALPPESPIAEPTRTPTPEEPTATPTQAEPTASPTQAEPTASPTPAAPLVAHVRFEPPSLSLPDTNPHGVRLVNDGPGWLVIRDVTERAPSGVTLKVDSHPCKGRKIPPGDSCPISVAMGEPLRSDVPNASLLISDNAPDSPQSYAIRLQSWIQATPPRVDFGSLDVRQIREKLGLKVVELTNVSDSIVQARVEVRGSAFTRERSNCGEPMKPGDRCSVSLRFLPRQAGSFDGMILVGAAGRPAVAIPVTGTARVE